MLTPSIRTIWTMMRDLDATQVVALRRLLERGTTPAEVDRALECANSLLNGYGVVSVLDNDDAPYYRDIGVLYVNRGETYTPTVLYDTRRGRFFITSWGAYVQSSTKMLKRFDV